jgi:hypothetical protein
MQHRETRRADEQSFTKGFEPMDGCGNFLLQSQASIRGLMVRGDGIEAVLESDEAPVRSMVSSGVLEYLNFFRPLMRTSSPRPEVSIWRL